MKSRTLLGNFAIGIALTGIGACGGEAHDTDAVATTSDELKIEVRTSTLTPTDDARIQAGSGDVNFGSAQLWINTEASHYSLVKFDLNELPPGATIESARLVLHTIANNDATRTVELGGVNGSWTEDTITWNNAPDVVWGGPTAVVSGPDETDVEWDVTSLVRAWYDGARDNEGFGLRGQGNGLGKLFHSKDTSAEFGPRLVIEYTAPVLVGPLPDEGDAADSSNHHGVVNMAYPGVPGQFPTVWTAGLPSGPRHANPTVWGLLGQVITAEYDADLQPDSDGPSNILLDGSGGLSPLYRNNDRGDDGWLNRNRLFFNCQRDELKVRVSRASNQQGTMYLNVWFDGEHDGDFDGIAPCTPPGGGQPQPSYEWILQDQPINMNAIAPGGYSDLTFLTERVLNTSLNQRHWIRFTLSEQPAVAPGGGALPDGRGRPYPIDPDGFKYGETEDFIHFIPPGEPGELILEKRVKADSDPVGYPDTVTYQIRLKHVGGTVPVQASIRDLLPLPLAEMHVIGPIDVDGTPNGAGPLVATLGLEPSELKHGVSWDGVLAPNSEVTLEFPVHVHVDCPVYQREKVVTNVVNAHSGSIDVSAQASFDADCPGEIVGVPVETPIELDKLPPFLR